MVKSRKAKRTQSPGVKLSEEEQWRLIQKSGVLQRPEISSVEGEGKANEEGKAEEIFNAVLLIVPFSFLLLMMEILIHLQYQRKLTTDAVFSRLTTAVPIMSIFIFYTNRHKQEWRMQIFLFLLSVLCGTRMIYQINRASWLVNMRQGPPLATAWIYTIVQLNLIPATLSLFIIAAWVRWTGMKIIF